MAYSADLRQRVVEFVGEGGSKAEAARRFRVSIWCVHDWYGRADLTPKYPRTRRRKLDRVALRQHVRQHPEATLQERARHFGVQINAIWYALRQGQITRKKNSTVRGAGPGKTRRLPRPAAAAPSDPTNSPGGLS